jgi:hypothetical protein
MKELMHIKTIKMPLLPGRLVNPKVILRQLRFLAVRLISCKLEHNPSRIFTIQRTLKLYIIQLRKCPKTSDLQVKEAREPGK